MSGSSINIIVEKNVPFVHGLLEEYAAVRYLPSDEITPAAVRDADAMIIRTRTRCDEGLLGGSRCRLIATATIGMDHIDLPYCRSRGITVVNAPGCNAPAVAQYVFSSLMAVINRPLSSYTIGIIGVGHVGSLVERWARGFGMSVMRNDPPRQQAGDAGLWVSIDEIARCADIITLHVPYVKSGNYSTHRLVDSTFLRKLGRAPILINSSRGAIFDTEAVTRAGLAGLVGPLIVDCWEYEPAISRDLLSMAAIATPHIAGYSKEGKIRASQAALDAVTSYFGFPRLTVNEPTPPAPAATICYWDLLASYDPTADTAALKAEPTAFERLRNHYVLRHEVPEGHCSE